MQHTINNTHVNTDVIGNTNTITSTNIDNIINQIKYINDHYFVRTDAVPMSLNVIEEPPKEEPKKEGKDLSGMRCRSWLLTINNFTDDDILQIKAENTTYKVWQYEKGKKGTLHLHCLLYYKNARIWPKKRFPTARIEIPRDLGDCIRYCQKEKTRIEGPWEVGECPAQGRRKDLEAIAEDISKGKGLNEIANENPKEFIRYHRGLQALKEAHMKPRDPETPMEVCWIFGNAGNGKTRFAYESHIGEEIYMKENNKWWNGYAQQDIIIWDDFCTPISGVGNHEASLRFFLRITDRYPAQGETKGGTIQINSKIMYITCEHPPELVFGGTENESKQCMRRINKIVKINDNKTLEVIK